MGTSWILARGGRQREHRIFLRSRRHRGKRGHVQFTHRHHHHHHRVNESAMVLFSCSLFGAAYTRTHTHTRTPGIFPFIRFSSRALKGWTRARSGLCLAFFEFCDDWPPHSDFGFFDGGSFNFFLLLLLFFFLSVATIIIGSFLRG